MRSVAILSLHTSPLTQPGTGDGGGMNVYVRELSSALTRAGIDCEVFTRTWSDELPATVQVEPGFRLHHVAAGPPREIGRGVLPEVVPEFTDGVRKALDSLPDVGAIHANYWLSGVAGHRLKHELGLPLVSTFHTLARVKAVSEVAEPEARARAEADVIGCSDAILASCADEATQLVRHYGADPTRIEIVPPGVEHAFFSRGPKRGARSALGVGLDGEPVLLFVGRIQPLKGVDVAVQALAALADRRAVLLVVGGPSGPDGGAELARLHALAAELGVAARVRFVDPQPHHLLSTYYRAADVCLVPSRSESFGLVALEAAACGTPVVAAAVGGLRTLVEHGRTGFLVEGRDPEAFAAYAGELLGSERLAASVGAAAAARAGRYTWSTSAARLRRLYTDLAARRLVECR